ncbi:hypothetical protein KBD18_00210 [Patescibacteria group bacterium]|nr:hypothetical protein [Patescibacteria group bacterium]
MADLSSGIPEHRVALSVVAAASAVMLAFSFLWIGQQIRKPFEPKGPGRFLTIEQQAAEQEAALKVRDTDGDGLNDYEEINIYHTSAYLSDTDSDSAADGTEITAGDDPNCPKDKTCQSSAYYAAPSSSVNPENLIDKNQFVDFGFAGAGTTAGIFEGFDPAQVRALLKSSGMSEEQLAQISDEELKKVYDEALADQVPTSTIQKLDTQFEKANNQNQVTSTKP